MNQQEITLTREQKDQKLFCFTIGLLISFMPISLLLNNLSNHFLYEGFIYDTLLCYGIVWLMVGLCVCKCLTNLRIDMWFFIALFCSFWAYTYLCMPVNRYFMYQSYRDIINNPLYILFVYSFSGYIIVRAVTDYELLNDMLKKFSVVTVWVSIITFLFDFYVKEVQTNYMMFSYNMLPHVTFLALGESKNHTSGHRLLGYIGILLCFILGCRGALVGFGASFLMKLFFSKKPTLTKIVQVVSMASMLVVTIFFFEDIISWLISFTESLGINSRTLSYMQEGRFFDDTGRSRIQDAVIDGISMTGTGMYGDRLTDSHFGSYCHNIIVEFLSQYGYILGSILTVSLIMLIIRGVFSKNHNVRLLIIIFIATGFIKLLFSGSYLNQEPSFYILIGLCTGVARARKEDNQDENTMDMQHNAAIGSKAK